MDASRECTNNKKNTKGAIGRRKPMKNMIMREKFERTSRQLIDDKYEHLKYKVPIL